MLQAFLVVPGVRARLPGRRADPAAPADRATAAWPARRWSSPRLVGGDRAAGAGRGPAVHRRLAAQQRARADLRLQRLRPAHRQRDRQRRAAGAATAAACGARPAGPGCSASEMGGQIAWLLPAALILLVAGLWFTRRPPRTDRTRAALVAVGRLAAGDRARLQPRQGNHPSVLHGRARARRSVPWSASARRACGGCAATGASGAARGHRRHDGGAGSSCCSTAPRLAALASLRHPRRGPGRPRCCCWCVAAGHAGSAPRWPPLALLAGLAGPAAYADRHRGHARTPARSRARGRRARPGRVRWPRRLGGRRRWLPGRRARGGFGGAPGGLSAALPGYCRRHRGTVGGTAGGTVGGTAGGTSGAPAGGGPAACSMPARRSRRGQSR